MIGEHKRSHVWVVNLGLLANILLAALKTTIGILGHSAALLADGINSTSDVAYYVVVRVFMSLARKPADAEHPYGHQQLESIAALVVGSFVVTTAIAIFWDAINRVYDIFTGGSSYGIIGIGALWVALFTVIAKIGLAIVTRRVGLQSGNTAILALAYDHRNDVFSAAGAAVGIFLGHQGYAWADPLIGAGVALIVLKTGIEILRQSSADLMDTVPGKPLEQEVRRALAGHAAVKAVEEIHAHRFGPYLVMNITVAIDGSMTLAQGDAVALDVERRIHANVDYVRRVYVHYHPVGSPPSPYTSYGVTRGAGS